MVVVVMLIVDAFIAGRMWGEPVLSPPVIEEAVATEVIQQEEVAAVEVILQTGCAASLSPSWPVAIQQWKPLIEGWAAQYCMDANLVAAVMTVESGGRQYAISRAGAIGLMQIMPRFHKCATYDPDGNIGCGVFILASYYHRAGDDWRTGLAYYNCGETGVKQGRCGKNGGYPYADLTISLWKSHP